MAIVEFKNVSKIYQNGEHEQDAHERDQSGLAEGGVGQVIQRFNTSHFPHSDGQSFPVRNFTNLLLYDTIPPF